MKKRKKRVVKILLDLSEPFDEKIKQILYGISSDKDLMEGREITYPLLRRSIWNDYIGENKKVGKCYVCKGLITQNSFECGHIEVDNQNEPLDLRNIRPVCNNCFSCVGRRKGIKKIGSCTE